MCFLYYFICKIKYNNLKKQEDGSEKLSSCFEMNQKVIFKAFLLPNCQREGLVLFPYCLLAEVYSNSFEFDVLIAEIHEPVEGVAVAP